MNKTLLLNLISIIYLLSLVSANAEESTYRHWPFDKLIKNGAATPDDSPDTCKA